MADNRLYTMVRAYAAAKSRSRGDVSEAVASVVRKAKRRAEREGVDTSPGSVWADSVVRFLVREYSPADREFAQDETGAGEWLAAL